MRGSFFVIVVCALVVAISLQGCKNGHHHDAVAIHEQGPHGEMLHHAGEHMPLSGQKEDDVRVVEVKAFRFAFDPDVIVVRKGEKVRLRAMSTDVTHGIDIDALHINRTLPPHEEQVIEFTPEKVGDFHFHCSVYCGAGHGKMHGTLRVIE